jgi:ribosomal protein S18 acetylase RimI-like enzyme
MDDLSIRDFRSDDIESVLTIMVESFEDKFSVGSKSTPEGVRTLVSGSGILHDTPFPGYLVAEHDRDVVGVMLLGWAGQERPPYMPSVPRETTWWERTRLRMALSMLDHGPREGECYVEFIAVAREARRKGAGRAMLAHAIEVARGRGLDRLGLFVASVNENAISVYEGLGMCRTRLMRSMITRRLFGVEEWWFMELPIV